MNSDTCLWDLRKKEKRHFIAIVFARNEVSYFSSG